MLSLGVDHLRPDLILTKIYLKNHSKRDTKDINYRRILFIIGISAIFHLYRSATRDYYYTTPYEGINNIIE